GMAKTMPAVESAQPGAAASGVPSNAGTYGADKPPAFVIINPRKSDGASGSLVSWPAQPIAVPTGPGAGVPGPVGTAIGCAGQETRLPDAPSDFRGLMITKAGGLSAPYVPALDGTPEAAAPG